SSHCHVSTGSASSAMPAACKMRRDSTSCVHGRHKCTLPSIAAPCGGLNANVKSPSGVPYMSRWSASAMLHCAHWTAGFDSDAAMSCLLLGGEVSLLYVYYLARLALPASLLVAVDVLHCWNVPGTLANSATSKL